MKIRLKHTGEVVEADVNIDGNGKFIGFTVNRLGIPGAEIFYPKEAVAEAPDWDAYRREAAKDILSAIAVNTCEFSERSRQAAVKTALQYADELIKQLQEK